MRLHEITDNTSAQLFLQVPLHIYKDDPNYIRPLNKDVTEVFDPKKNKAFRHGECARWVLFQDDELIGRIAAFVNKKYRNKGDEQPTGGIGFFECINSQEAADVLFDVAKSWLMQRNMEAMDGPINFGERDRWWGLVVEGYKPPIYLMNYNLPYYKDLFETYGFKIFYNQICWHLFVQQKLNAKFYEQHAKYSAMEEYSVRHTKKSDINKFAEDFTTVYNDAWSKHEGNKSLNKEAAKKMFLAIKSVIDEDLIWFAYHKDRPIAFWVNLPELNQIFKHLNGEFSLWAKLKFMYYKWKKTCNKFTGIAFGVIPDFQSQGVDYYMIVEAARRIQPKKRYNELELQWQGDFNPRMLNISKNLGASQSRMLRTYRYMFDRSKEVKRHPILN
ncbi:GNAT family N-acetyltransferase [soil metagenome]